MTDYRDREPQILDDSGSSAAGWSFALVVTAVLAFGAWYILAA